PWLSFFFSSRRRHTRCYRDWSSDVCSSDLGRRARGIALDPAPDIVVIELLRPEESGERLPHHTLRVVGELLRDHRGVELVGLVRSEERRVGKQCSSRWAPDPYQPRRAPDSL